MADNLFDLARAVPGLDVDEMDPLNILAQTIERLGAVGQGNLTSAVTQEDVARWAGEIAGTVEGGRGSGWEAAEKIRSDILKWRVGQDQLEETFGMTSAQAQAAMEVGGDIAGTVIQSGGEHPGTINPYSPSKTITETIYNEDGTVTYVYSDGTTETVGTPKVESKQSIINRMQDAFMLALRNAGMSTENITALWTWAHAKFKADPSFTAERALLEMYDQPAFKERFPAIANMRERGEKNIPTPGEYIAFEKDVGTSLRQFGVEYTAGEHRDLITTLIENNVGMPEVNERLTEAERITYSVPREVQETLMQWYSPTWAKSIEMKMFLDPTQDWASVQDDIETAEVGGWGKMVAGLDEGWNAEMANQIADLGLSQAQVWNSFANLKQEEALFAEQVGEDTNLQYETHGVSSQFGIDIAGEDDALELKDMLERRKQRRISRFAGGGTGQAGAIISGQTTGIGAANA